MATGLALPRPAGDPDALGAARDALVTPAAGLVTFAAQLDEQAAVPGWQGPAAAAFAQLVHDIAHRFRSAVRVIGDAEHAFGSLSGSLQAAVDIWDLGMAGWQEGPVRGLLVQADEDASSAHRLARQQLDAATQHLAPLTAESNAQLPKGLVFPINPCGLVPEEAADAFWNLGVMPINTECLAFSEVTIFVDGEPVETLEALPIRSDTNESTSKGGQTKSIQTPEEKLRIRNRIRRMLQVGSEGDKFEANTAQSLLARGFQILKYRWEYILSTGARGEIDIETPEAMIEVTIGAEGKQSQALGYKDPSVNPSGKPVIVYAPNYSAGAARQLANNGISVARDLDALANMLHALRG